MKKRLESEDQLKKDFDSYQSLKKGLVEFGYQNFSKKISSWEQEILEDEKVKVRPLKNWMLFAASISFLIIVTFSWWFLSGTMSSTELYADFYSPYPDVITSRGSEQSKLNNGLFLYESEQYGKAVKELEKFIIEYPAKKEALFYLGQAYLANDEEDKAIPLFKELKSSPDFSFVEATEWYLALSYLKVGDMNKAKKELSQISSSAKHAYRKQSQKLLERIN